MTAMVMAATILTKSAIRQALIESNLKTLVWVTLYTQMELNGQDCREWCEIDKMVKDLIKPIMVGGHWEWGGVL